ncbi:hypothetical protein ABZT04_31130 [Streptomyces sp. NPDC005492]|uniref:hypothetical protein n=1 Tax=Streptomyces sp. NPDC005492 TaxID=3156883 RepID=UPI0033BCEBD9
MSHLTALLEQHVAGGVSPERSPSWTAQARWRPRPWERRSPQARRHRRRACAHRRPCRLPEPASPKVVRTPASELDDVVSAARLLTVEDVLSSHSGWGFGINLTAPVQGVLVVRATGRGLPEFLAEPVFEPLGLTDGCPGQMPLRLRLVPHRATFAPT